MTTNSSKPYYTLFVFNKDANEWEDVFGSYVRAECVEEGQEYFGQRKKIMRNDGTHGGLRSNYADLGQPMRGLEPSNGATVLLSERFPHPMDSHLHHVLCYWNDQFVVWSFNKQDGGCYYGAYFSSVLDARANFDARVQAKAQEFAQ